MEKSNGNRCSTLTLEDKIKEFKKKTQTIAYHCKKQHSKHKPENDQAGSLGGVGKTE